MSHKVMEVGFAVPELGYSFDALEPYIDAMTMEIHHDKHHGGYVSNLNAALEGLDDLASRSIEDLLRNIKDVPETKRQAVINNGGGHANHTLLWQILKKNEGRGPRGDLGKAMDKAFGSFGGFREQFTNAAKTRFGSGWAWLGLDPQGKLHIGSTPNQDSPLMAGHRPIMGIDVWEHAYYLKYQNRRPEYIEAFFNVIDWDRVADFYREAME